jgi:hypothetical protein
VSGLRKSDTLLRLRTASCFSLLRPETWCWVTSVTFLPCPWRTKLEACPLSLLWVNLPSSAPNAKRLKRAASATNTVCTVSRNWTCGSAPTGCFTAKGAAPPATTNRRTELASPSVHHFLRAGSRGGESHTFGQLKTAPRSATIPSTTAMGPKTRPPNQFR